MFKFIISVSILLLHFSVHAEQRSFKKSSPDAAIVQITTGSPQQSVQAADFVDAMENKQFIEMMLSDKASQLAKIRRDLELENCGKESVDGKWIESCGQVQLTDYVLTSFGRLGWMMAGASYSFFVGFRMDGTGRYFNSSYLVTINETVEANENGNRNYTGSLVKSLKKIKSCFY
ncbi:MAG: hypothetical protein ACXWRZ_15380 [Bdellovibrio sp.]